MIRAKGKNRRVIPCPWRGGEGREVGLSLVALDNLEPLVAFVAWGWEWGEMVPLCRGRSGERSSRGYHGCPLSTSSLFCPLPVPSVFMPLWQWALTLAQGMAACTLGEERGS